MYINVMLPSALLLSKVNDKETAAVKCTVFRFIFASWQCNRLLSLFKNSREDTFTDMILIFFTHSSLNNPAETVEPNLLMYFTPE